MGRTMRGGPSGEDRVGRTTRGGLFGEDRVGRNMWEDPVGRIAWEDQVGRTTQGEPRETWASLGPLPSWEAPPQHLLLAPQFPLWRW